MKLKLEQHDSPDRGIIYYYIVIDNFNIYSTLDLTEAEERFEHIKDIGITAYMKEIRITKTILKEEDIADVKSNDSIDVK